ncbi:polyribonucleotide nucleotidyltransferase [Acrasis kona]|uniref:Polyribonucleotide nucleotidyltransferase n=1 Tax=Acrasis kona TaxID=1008807 RepID=A0AAW2YJZ8_9EUKA
MTDIIEMTALGHLCVIEMTTQGHNTTKVVNQVRHVEIMTVIVHVLGRTQGHPQGLKTDDVRLLENVVHIMIDVHVLGHTQGHPQGLKISDVRPQENAVHVMTLTVTTMTNVQILATLVIQERENVHPLREGPLHQLKG